MNAGNAPRPTVAPRHSPWPALLYLWRRSFWNGWRSRIRRLRKPRYAVAFVLGLAYLVFSLFGVFVLGNGTDHADPAQVLNVAKVLLPLMAAVFVPVSWIGGQSHMVLAFKPPEVQFLFQGPIARRTLVDYKLLRAQAPILVMVALLTLILHVLLPLPWPLIGVGIWLILATVHLHQVGAGLVRASWTHHGRAGLRRHWLLPAIILAGGLVVVVTLLRAVPAMIAAGTGGALFQVLGNALSRPAPALVLLPFRVLVAPLLAPGPGAWALAMLGTVCLWALHYVWVIRTDTAFEETAVQAGAALQEITSAFREGRGFAAVRAQRRRPVNAAWFRLEPVGHPAVAIFWKNLTAFTRSLSVSTVAMIVLVLVGYRVALPFIANTPRKATFGAAQLPAMFAVMALIMGPLRLRNDLRTDIQRQELLRAFPLAGRDIVAAEVAASATSLLLVVAFFLTIAAAFLALPHLVLPRFWMLPAAWAAALVAAAPLALLTMCIQNAMAVLYPAWANLGPTQQPGLDQMGGMILMTLVNGVLTILGLLPPLLVGAFVAFQLYLMLGAWAAVPAALAVWLALFAECVGVVVLLGRAYDRMDPSEIGLLP